MIARLRQESESESGAALLLVIWTLTLLAVIAAAVTSDVRAALRLTSNVTEAGKARAFADAGVWAAISTALEPENRLLLDGSEMTLSASGDSVTVAMQDEGGRLDLNQSSEAVLQGLLVAVGLERQAAVTLARSIVDHRARLTDLLNKGSSGVQATWGTGEHGRSRPKLPFVSLFELKTVPGLSGEHYRRLAPFLTVYGGDWRVNPRTAPLEVLAALPGMDSAKAGAYLDLRHKKANDIGDLRLATPTEIGAQAQWRRPRIVTVRATAELPSGARFVREAVVDLQPGHGRAYDVLAWPNAQF